MDLILINTFDRTLIKFKPDNHKMDYYYYYHLLNDVPKDSIGSFLGGLNNRLISPSSGGWESKTKVPADSVPYESQFSGW